MRETYHPLWEKRIYVKETRITLPYLQDNYFFVVQSVDVGHESVPILPAPARRR
ncbi:MAG: hypothetical protein GY834_04815 [Bacteroidetes bacterium]|nr:hypothetical protein [Bacteroidota bacterium]